MTTTIDSPKRINDVTILLLVGLGVAAVHVAANGQYGFHRDELDILMNARQLDWGYVSYPPVTPLLARIGLTLFGDSLRGLRLFSALAQGVVAVLVGLMARDFGGKRPAQLLAALAVAISPVALMAGTLIQYMAFDYLWWVLLSFFVVRVLATEDPRWWLGVGAAVGLGMMTKYTIFFFVVGLVTAVLITSTRRALRSRYLWFGVGLALLIYLPNLIWQVQHEFISLHFLSSIHARDLAWGRGEGFLPKQLYENANPFVLPLWIAGLIFCLFLPAGKRFRAVGWMFLITFALFLVARGRSYYLGPAYAMLIAAGATWWESWLAARRPTGRRVGWVALWALVAMGGVVGIVLLKPIAPINSPLWGITSDINGEVVEMVGWPDLVEQVATIYASIPDAEKPGVAILAGNYGEAGALDLYGPQYGLPRVISGANSLWARGYGDPPPETVIVVGFESSYATTLFKDCKMAGTVTNRYGVKNEESSYHTGLYVCRAPRQPWPEMWETMQWFQ
jgi:4-amino-4-deoxy-L-arabinose transferase-like glycosyltransferase